MFLKRASNYKNVFDPSIGFMRGRTADGNWISPFYPQEPYYNFMMKEASGWSTLWLVPYDVQGLINLLGGRQKLVAKLDEFFAIPYHPKGICRDCTGVIGQYVQGNQPDQQSAYFYDWGGAPWKTQELTRRILSQLYGSDKYGLGFPGMDDQGSSSSWYVLSAMGFYTVDPAEPVYLLGSPLFNQVTIHLGNGKPLNKPWFNHADIAGGGRLVLNMGPAPNNAWGSSPADARLPCPNRGSTVRVNTLAFSKVRRRHLGLLLSPKMPQSQGNKLNLIARGQNCQAFHLLTTTLTDHYFTE